MVNKKSRIGKRAYVDLEPALKEAARNCLITCDKSITSKTRNLVEQIIKNVVDAMKKQSPVFARLYSRNFGGGSIYDGLKIGNADEFDIDILLKLPDLVEPVLISDGVAGFAQLKLKKFQNLAKVDPEMFKVLSKFVDEENHLLPKKMKSLFIQSVFDKTLNEQLPNGIVLRKYKISKVQHLGPALTLTLNGPNLDGVCVDLVPSILLGKEFWPTDGCRKNPHLSPNLQEFFLSPTTPKQDHFHRERFWRLSFHIQERKIIFNRFFMKPSIKILKRMRDRLSHNIRSYAIKTVFLWELENADPALDGGTSDDSVFWGPHSFVLVYMLEKYYLCLKKRNIPDFWNPDLNLLCHLSEAQLDQYEKDVGSMLLNIKSRPTSETLMKYLE